MSNIRNLSTMFEEKMTALWGGFFVFDQDDRLG